MLNITPESLTNSINLILICWNSVLILNSRGKSSITIQGHAVLSLNIAEAAGDNCSGYSESLDGGAIASHGESIVTVIDWSSMVGNR
jgi:hypothetical protein